MLYCLLFQSRRIKEEKTMSHSQKEDIMKFIAFLDKDQNKFISKTL